MCDPVREILSVILIGGLVGGLGSAFLQNFLHVAETAAAVNRFKCDWQILLKSIALGIAASFVVPIFLEIAAVGNDKSVVSSILSNEGCTNERWNGLFLLMGFCTLAAVSAQRFLTRMEEQILDKVNKAMAKAETASQQVHAVRGEALRAQEKAEDAETMAEALSEPEFVSRGVSPSSDRLLRAFIEVPSRTPTTPELQEILGTTSAELDVMIDESRDAGLIRETFGQDDRQLRWKLGGWGKRRAFKLMNLEELDRKVLNSIYTLSLEKGIRRPTLLNIAKDLQQQESSIEQSLARLLKFGFVAESTSEVGGWRIRSWGRRELTNLENTAHHTSR